MAKCDWCGDEVDTREATRWDGVYFCSDKCLDECRAIQ